MILEGFEIENWSCIRKASVPDLPPSGLIVLHGPNRTGKSSIVQALRACLMDYASTTTALKSWYPRGTGEKPVVCVTFRTGGRSYRIKKCFGSNKSELASQTATGDWRIETQSAADAHERTCGLVGGSDSAKGLHQLLWLTQAEFHLPEAKKFDAGVQAQLRGILGVLQTPLDDRFIEHVKERWSVWYSGQRKTGKQQQIKAGCKLAENLQRLTADQQVLHDSESKFREMEGLLRHAEDLEQALRDLNRQVEERTGELASRQEEHQRSQSRIVARQQAEKDHAVAEKERVSALDEQQQRAAASNRCQADEHALEPAREKMEATAQRVNELEITRTKQRATLLAQRDKRRYLQQRANQVAARLGALGDAEKLSAAQEDLNRTQAIADEVDGLRSFLADNPAPDAKQLDELKENRQKVARLQADCDAASMHLTIAPVANAVAARLALDNRPPKELPDSAAPAIHTVRRKADLFIVGFGRVEVTRGTDQADVDQIEEELRCCNEEFSNAVAAFGITGNDPNALDQLIHRAAEHRLKHADFASKMKELKKLAPAGLEPLEAKVRQLKTKAEDVSGVETAGVEPLPDVRNDLDQLAATLQQQLGEADDGIKGLESEGDAIEEKLRVARLEEMAAKEALAAGMATAKSSREELDRLRPVEQIAQRISDANRALEDAQVRLERTTLTNDELTIDERLKAAEQAVAALQSQIADSTRKFDVIRGRLLESEGLHARRSSLAARVDELTRLTERESLEKDAVDRLYTLFEECREKQLGTLLGPIHDRVLGWMRVLDIGDYQQVRFNDAFLPEKLMNRDGTAEFTVAEESTGAQEQIGMLVRLALGSTLASTAEPAVAILDDPLTHCDIGRLSKMRSILRSAAEGNPNLTPPAGPLQIVVLTCHPEWFRDERATVIDLESPEVMIRLPV